MANRDEIVKRIKALRAKAEDAASTEAEAVQCAEMAARLLVKNDIKPDELADVEKSEGHVSGFRQGKVMHPVARWTAHVISQLTETRGYEVGGEVNFIGLEEDVIMAVYLIEMFTATAKRVWIAHGEANPNVFTIKKMGWMTIRESMFMGFAHRMNEKMLELVQFRKEQRMNTHGGFGSSALVVVKEQVILRKMEEMGLEIGAPEKAKKIHVDPEAYVKGYAAAGDVNINRPFGRDVNAGELE